MRLLGITAACALFLCELLSAATYREVRIKSETRVSDTAIAMTNDGAVVIWTTNNAIFTAAIAPNGDTIGPTKIGPPAAPSIAANGRDLIAAWTIPTIQGVKIYFAPFDSSGRLRSAPFVLSSDEMVWGSYVGTAALGDRFLAAWFAYQETPVEVRWVILDRDAHPIGRVHTYSAPWLRRPLPDEQVRVSGSDDVFALLVPIFGLNTFDVSALVIDRNGEIASNPIVIGTGSFPAIASDGRDFVVAWDDSDKNRSVALRKLRRDGTLGTITRRFAIDGFLGGTVAWDGSARVLSLASACHFGCISVSWSMSRILDDGKVIEELDPISCADCGLMAVAAKNGLIAAALPWGEDTINVRWINLRTSRSRAVGR